jgi:hypothetical protein
MLDARMAPAFSPELGDTTTGRLHFVAYAMGVAQLTAFPAQPVMNVTSAPVLRCAHPQPQPQPQLPQQEPPRSKLPLALAIASPLALALAAGAAAAFFLARRRRRMRAAADANAEPLMEQASASTIQ